MKISYLFGELGSTGGSIVLYNFMDNLVERGYEIYAILPDKRIKWEVGIWKEIIENNESKHTSKAVNNIINFFTKNNTKLENLNYYYALKKFTDGLIHNWVESDITISTYSLTTYAGYYLSKKTVPLYHMQHFEELFFTDINQRLIARNTYYLPLIKISNSKWLQNILKTQLNINSYLLNPGIDLNLFKPYKEFTTKYYDKKEWLIVSYFSEEPLKGFNDAAKGVKLARDYLNKKGINLKWKVFGLNPPSRKYETEFEYVGKIFGKDLAKLYSKADIVLMASWYESFPLPPIEAMACGTLIIATRYGTEDYVFDKENGLVCLPRQPEEITNKIIYAIENPEKCLEMVKNGQKTVKNYSWEKRTDILEEILLKSAQNYSFDKFKLFDDLVNANFKKYMYNEFKTFDNLNPKKI